MHPSVSTVNTFSYLIVSSGTDILWSWYIWFLEDTILKRCKIPENIRQKITFTTFILHIDMQASQDLQAKGRSSQVPFFPSLLTD